MTVDPIRHGYCLVSDVASWLSDDATWHDADPTLLRLINWASRRVDDYCQRHIIGPRVDTRHLDLGWGGLRNDSLLYTRIRYLPSWDRVMLESGTVIGGTIALSDWLLTPLAVTVYTDSNEGTSFSYSQAIPGDPGYIANPGNYQYWLDPPDRNPKLNLKLNELASAFLYGGQRTLHISGIWGWQDKRTQVASLHGAIDGVTGTVTVDSVASLQAGQTIIVDAEQMYILARNQTTAVLTVERGANGTTAVAHLDGAAVSTFVYPEAVTQAVIDLVRIRYRRRDLGANMTVADPAMGVMLLPSKEEAGILCDLDVPFRSTAGMSGRGSF